MPLQRLSLKSVVLIFIIAAVLSIHYTSHEPFSVEKKVHHQREAELDNQNQTEVKLNDVIINDHILESGHNKPSNVNHNNSDTYANNNSVISYANNNKIFSNDVIDHHNSSMNKTSTFVNIDNNNTDAVVGKRIPQEINVTDIKVNNKGIKENDTVNRTKNNTHIPDHSPPCTIKQSPVPIILMSLGRSGTASMYQVLYKLSSSGSNEKGIPRMYEYTGGSTEKSQIFFQQTIPAEDIYGDWLVQLMCHEQNQHPNAGVVGFKWKPYKTTLTEDKARQGLELLSRLKDIKVIRSRRNLLDVQISRHKHSLGKINAHCQKDDKDCIQQQIKGGTGMILPTRKLVEELKKLDDMENRVDDLLMKLNVPTIKVSFEKLFQSGDDVSEWQRIFTYLGVGPTSNLTSRDVEKAGHAATSIPFHNVTLKNYDEVKATLASSQFKTLLH